ncbi:hypothetical protein ACTVZO_04095 [Streptomyces sp. IBSNAI002]|uniref:hypothetical protein n=1 Tax=Streptomyces sp. IBSNAI002 TaxID=3457500 RepID=UPI003FD0CF73
MTSAAAPGTPASDPGPRKRNAPGPAHPETGPSAEVPEPDGGPAWKGWAAVALIAVLPGAAAGTVLLLAWGLAYGGVSVSLQRWMLCAAPASAEAATSLMVAVFNLAIAAGALLGGLAVDGVSAPAAPLAGAALMLLAAGTVWATSIRR